MRYDGSIDKLDHRMNNTLRMNDDLYGGVTPKQPFCFDVFQAFVHHRRRVYGDLVTHFPVGMVEGFFSGNVFHLLPGKGAKGATGPGEDYFFDAIFFFSVKYL